MAQVVIPYRLTKRTFSWELRKEKRIPSSCRQETHILEDYGSLTCKERAPQSSLLGAQMRAQCTGGLWRRWGLVFWMTRRVFLEASGTRQVGSALLGPEGEGSMSRFVFSSRLKENPGQTAHAGSGLCIRGGEAERNAFGQELILALEL